MGTPALPESCSRLTPLFRGELFAVDDWRCAGDNTPGRREEWAPDDCVVVTRRGAWELETGGDARLADALTATLWNRGAYRVRHPVGGGDECTVFRLTAAGTRAFRELPRSGVTRDPAPTFAGGSRPIDGRAYLLHRHALAAARTLRGASDPLGVEEPALGFLHRIAGGAAAERSRAELGARHTSRYVDRARDLIARDFREPLSLGRMAREVGCSPFHLSRLFRCTTGTTLHRAVMRMRLREGLERLLDEPGHLSAIALAVGFASHSHFADAFRTEFGCSPSHARRHLGVRARRAIATRR